AGHAGG
ncbi:hypothetical protein MKD33_14655, partial [Chromobacterium piscinae]